MTAGASTLVLGPVFPLVVLDLMGVLDWIWVEVVEAASLVVDLAFFFFASTFLATSACFFSFLAFSALALVSLNYLAGDF